MKDTFLKRPKSFNARKITKIPPRILKTPMLSLIKLAAFPDAAPASVKTIVNAKISYYHNTKQI